MKGGDFLSGIYYFFNDFVGSVIPGLALILGLVAIGNGHFGPSFRAILDFPAGWVLLLVVAFVTGHVVLALESWCEEVGLVPKVQIDENRESVKAFRDLCSGKLSRDLSKLSAHELRSVAMSISPDAGEIGRRFMFISLSCLGTAISLSVLLVSLVAMQFALLVRSPYLWVVLLILAISILLLIQRGREFKERALNTPFSIALAILPLSASDRDV